MLIYKGFRVFPQHCKSSCVSPSGTAADVRQNECRGAQPDSQQCTYDTCQNTLNILLNKWLLRPPLMILSPLSLLSLSQLLLTDSCPPPPPLSCTVLEWWRNTGFCRREVQSNYNKTKRAWSFSFSNHNSRVLEVKLARNLLLKLATCTSKICHC